MSPGLGLRKLQVCPMLAAVLGLNLRPFCTQVQGHPSHLATNLLNKYLLSFNLVQINSIVARNTHFGNKDSGSSPIPAIGKVDCFPLCVTCTCQDPFPAHRSNPAVRQPILIETWVCPVGFPTQSFSYVLLVSYLILHNSVLIPK